MSQFKFIALAIAGLVLASLACSTATSTPAPTPLPPTQAIATSTTAPTTAPTSAPAATPKPATTATRAPTAKPTTASQPAGVLFNEDFGSQQAAEDRGWVFEAGENVETAWAANKYIVSIKKKNWLGLNWPDGTYDDFGAEAEGQATGGSYAEYGIVFRVSGDQASRTYYIFGVNTDGKYYLQKKVDGQWADPDPVPATASTYVKSQAKNRLGVLAQGNKLSLYVNGFLVKTVTDDSSEEGMVGVYAGTGDNTSAQVTFSRFTILTAEKAKAEWGTTPASSGSQPTATAKPSTGSGNGVFTVRNTFGGFCRVNLWGKQNAEISADANSSKSLSLPPGTYGGKITLANGREGDISSQFYLPAGGYCVVTCYEKSYAGPACGQ